MSSIHSSAHLPACHHCIVRRTIFGRSCERPEWPPCVCLCEVSHMISRSRDLVMSQTVTSHRLTNHSGPVHIIQIIIIIVLDSVYIPSIVPQLSQILVSFSDQSWSLVCLTASHSSDKSLFVQRGLCWPNVGLVWWWVFCQPLHCNNFFLSYIMQSILHHTNAAHTHRILMNTQLVSQPGWVLTLIDNTEVAYWWCLAPCSSGSTWPRYRPGRLILHPGALKSAWLEEEDHT